MEDCLEEACRATYMNPRAAALYGGLCQPGERLVVIVWDSYPVKIEKPGDHKLQKATFSTKHHGNSLTRLEGCDLEGRPLFSLLLSASISPRGTDESLCAHQLEIEHVTGVTGGLTSMFVGTPRFRMTHLMDKGFW